MAKDYSVEVCRWLQKRFSAAKLHRPMRVSRYEPGTELCYEVQGITPANKGQVRLVIEKFVGGGFAGQVYRVKILEIDTSAGLIVGLQAGGTYAMKILIPPSGSARLFRNFLYWIGFAGPFQLQVNPAAARAGALWQKFIRRAAKIKFGDEQTVVDIHATFVDSTLGSCGELSEWVAGRTWRLEVDDRLDLLKQCHLGEEAEQNQLGSPEYRTKRKFMADFVKLLNEVGACEFARQYEWSTCKSQPNCLKRTDTEDNPTGGLVAVDFRAGLVLLPILPMSPGDFKLIGKGLLRGSIVQFDRGSVAKLETFVQTHKEHFADMSRLLDELKDAERIYRDSVPDITHNHIRLFYSRKLWSTILDSTVTGWQVRNMVDDATAARFRRNKIFLLLFLILGFVPFLGKMLRRLWARADWRRHYWAMLTGWGYLRRAVQAKMAEKLIGWHRAGRVSQQRSLALANQFWLFCGHLLLSVLPAGLHRFFTDKKFRNEKLVYIFIRPVRLYFNAELRQQWLRDMVNDGKKKHILTDQDADTILAQLHEPYIQRYLVSLVVHGLTVPLTQIVSVIVAWIYWRKTGDKIGAGGILVLFQVIPISPGSIARGLYSVGIAVYDRSFKDYNIAVFLSFFKYIGYLAFPIQMSYRYPTLARFMAAHWATAAAHIVPVFGERGALLEHGVFGLFYNRPLTIRWRMRLRAQWRAGLKPRYWHTSLCAIGAAVIFGIVDFLYIRSRQMSPGLQDIWWLSISAPLAAGALVTLWAAGAAFFRRIIAAAVCGATSGALYTAISVASGYALGIGDGRILISLIWRVFVFTILSTVGAIITELKLPEPRQE